ncbi:MAG: sulfite exporter TauE/SafE family protein [Spirochaetaceae bacterium]|jgi:sulfite exporter TauE/SafE/copper chaperone CopZ/plastocyanin domain-containing protein|nr:sulfite exporter TauE/SafE family protein [Spirochaetaceae bacterium]
METAEEQGLQKRSFNIGGMYCIHCQNTIEKELKNTAGVQNVEVHYNTGAAAVTYDTAIIGFDKISAIIEELGYHVPEGDIPVNRQPSQTNARAVPLRSGKNTVTHIVGTLVIILALFMLLRAFGTGRFAAAFPLAQEGMGYGMLLVIGLLTSVHCIAMCGGINLSQTLRGNREWGVGSGEWGKRTANTYSMLFPSILYNGGRLVSYTAVGVIVGALGSVITVSGRFQGAVQLVAGIFMVIMGINMLGLFPSLRRFIPQMPKLFAKKIDEQKTGRGPLVVGFLNGFMPCGPLQAMQLYALSTGSPLRGGISMFLFCIGTIPLMFALGAASSALSGAKGQAFSRRVMHIGAIFVAALGLVMFSNGWSLSGFINPLDRAASFKPAQSGTDAFVPVIQNGVQVINSTLQPGRYPAITVQQGVPVRWIINAPPSSINGCNNRMIIREYGIQHTFKQGDNVIEFTPAKAGRFRYSCWMAMIHSTITVLAEGESAADAREPDTAPKPAGVQIPTEKIALAQIADNVQTVTIRLGDEGFEPAIVVMQRMLPALWIINIDSVDPGNSSIVFPVYYAILETEQGENQLRLVPGEDFEFYTADSVFYGYVKVVNDIARVDVNAVKAEVADFETLIYPEAYFEAAYDY